MQSIPHLPRMSQLVDRAAARTASPAIPGTTVDTVLAMYGIAPTGRPRGLGLGRRSHNVVVATERGPLVVKQYRRDWPLARVAYGHSVLERLEALDSPAARLVRRADGGTWAEVDGRTFALFTWIPGRNVSADHLRRRDRERVAAAAGRILARLHEDLDGFEPAGQHHLGFVALDGPAHRPLAWYVDRLGQLAHTSHPLADRAAEIAGRLQALDATLSSVSLPRVVIHGDFGLHNLVFTSRSQAIPVDFELARIERRLTDVAKSISWFLARRHASDRPSLDAFLVAYARNQPLLPAEVALLPQVWADDRLRSAVRAWDAFDREGQPRHAAAAVERVDEADWVQSGPALVHHVASRLDARCAGGVHVPGAGHG